MKVLSLREIQTSELKIFDALVSFLDENNIPYFLAGGTMLGAIRHKGFIPWDDDIDIAIPRPDYERFLRLTKNSPIDGYFPVLSARYTNLHYPFIKIIDPNIVISGKSSDDKNLWVDVFPVDGFPKDIKKSKRIVRRAKFYKGIMYLKQTCFVDLFKEDKTLFNRILRVILKPFSLLFPAMFCAKRIEAIAQKYDYSSSSYCGVIAWGYGIQERIPKKYTEQKSVIFENRRCSGIVGYDYYLSSLYGNYMELPPVEKRSTHSIDARIIK